MVIQESCDLGLWSLCRIVARTEPVGVTCILLTKTTGERAVYLWRHSSAAVASATSVALYIEWFGTVTNLLFLNAFRCALYILNTAPPSIASTEPVMNDASSDSRKHTNLATSAAVAALGSSCASLAISFQSSAVLSAPRMLVCTSPGAIAFTLVPCSAASTACSGSSV
eukprot:1816-Heterococcus_DN1.PRE.4